jgi:AAA15 family ATPase/GTPase
MFKTIKFKNFKSWQDTGDISLASLTGFFGNNSSGKSSIIQFFLLLKQTVESSDRQRVLNTGDERSYVELGTLYDIAYNHIIPSVISFKLEWDLSEELNIFNPESSQEDVLFFLNSLEFYSEIKLNDNQIFLENFCYNFNYNSENISFKFKKNAEKDSCEYELQSEGYQQKRSRGTAWPLPDPIKNYGFPDQAISYFQNTGFLSDFSLAYEKAFEKKPIPVRSGGSIPIVAMFEKELGLKTILMGFGLNSDAIHSPNEHYGLFNFYKGIETIPYFYHYFTELNA